GNDVSFSRTRVRIGSNDIRINGTLGELLSLDADFDVVDIAEIFPDGAGSFRGTAALSGPVDQPDVRMDLSGAALEWREYSLGSFSANGTLSAVKKGRADLALERLTAGELTLDEARVSVSGQLGAHDVGIELRALESDLTVAAAGGYDDQGWSGQLASLAIDNDTVGRWATRDPSLLTVSADQASLSSTCLIGPQETNEVCLHGARVAGGPAEFDATVSGVSVAVIPASLPEGMSLAGYVYASLTGKWADGKLTAKSNIELRDGAIEAMYDEDHVVIAVSQALSETTVIDNQVDSTLRVDLADGAATGTIRLAAEDLLDNQSAISGRVDISSPDASSFAAIVPGILRPQGRVDGNLTIAGSLSSPEFLGEVSLTDASFGVRQTGIQVSDFNLRLTQLAPGQLRLVGQARSGHGQISVEGRTWIGSDSGIRSEIQLAGENFEFARLPDWQIAASPAISVVFDERATTTTGDLAIPAASIRARDIPVSAQSSSPDVVVHREESAQPSRARRIDVDIRTRLGDDVEFSGFGLTTGLEGAVQIRGGSHAVFTGQGRLTLSEGRYKAYGQDLEIERGELIFNGPLENPRLNVRAVRRIGDVAAGIEVSGVPTQLQSSVFSDPVMSDAEALSYLLTGRPLASATSAGDGNTLNNAAFALGMSGAANITSQVRTQLGLETLAIVGGADDSRLIAGKRFGDRLLVEYGYGLMDELGTLLLRYQLTSRIVLESRTGSVSNLDVVYSVKKK
ncbi:MAG: translocation/assembly module TamB domain-containing protein, partial [Gammaproteobacteria bacterium]|nr:translocation/assembly module TamB domain-containing protein [Gammaproteobacteria bacterium]